MGFMDSLKGAVGKILPNREKLAIRNNVPKEKENIKKSFGVYCNKNHGTKDGHLCNKCNALLLRIMTKIKACPYGTQAKPVCEMCDVKCFGPADMKQFLTILEESKNKMLMKHPMMAAKHRLLKAGTGYAKNEQEMKSSEAARAKRMAKREKARAKKAQAAAEKKEEK